ncbi:hypothetical protein [Bosea sp. (in: a-proteobacteria)]|nr:hypothetical protein [Bosea sp. (in: a-proteobacteria)]MBN9438063.1 hypothetical protein [Bosea sp. (in: a-proteobacteria)]
MARLYAEISKVTVPVDLSRLHTTKVRKAPPGWVPRANKLSAKLPSK